jgi:membrane protein implicated in regulation of membrane protease activity
MGIGTGIALFVIGAILAFAVNIDLGGVVNLSLIGYILMGAGFVVFVISLIFLLRRRQSVAETRSAVDPASGERVTRSTRDTNDPLV